MNGNCMLTDNFGRKYNYLRLSLTDRCNLRCSYCMPSQPVFMPDKNILDGEEIDKLTSTFVALGIRKVRLTGGEPLIRKDFDSIVKKISRYNASLHLTTNGYYLDKHILILKKYFSSINISLDTLQKDKFIYITQRNALEQILRNIDLCLQKEIPVKLNVVVKRNFNHDELGEFMLLTRDFPVEVRFIEFMPFRGNQWKLEDTFSHQEIILSLKEKFPIEAIQKNQNETAEKYRVKDWPGQIGIISTVSKPFCESCNRLRITAEGKLKNCLFGLKEYDLRPYLNNQESLEKNILESLGEKHLAHGGLDPLTQNSETSGYDQNRCMTSIGG